MSKYDKLWLYIKNSNKKEYKLTYKEIENILSFPLDHSFLKFKKELLEYGYEVSKISMKEEYILFREIK